MANVTEQQFQAVDITLSKLMAAYGFKSKNEALLYILKGMCTATDTQWPDVELKWGGNRHPLKNGGIDK